MWASFLLITVSSQQKQAGKFQNLSILFYLFGLLNLNIFYFLGFSLLFSFPTFDTYLNININAYMFSYIPVQTLWRIHLNSSPLLLSVSAITDGFSFKNWSHMLS